MKFVEAKRFSNLTEKIKILLNFVINVFSYTASSIFKNNIFPGPHTLSNLKHRNE